MQQDQACGAGVGHGHRGRLTGAQARLLADARAGRLHPSVLTALMAYAYGRPNLRDVPEPETPITIELNIPKPAGVMRRDSTG